MQEDIDVTQAVVVATSADDGDRAKINLVVDVMRDRLAEQLRQVGALDSRAGFILGSASLLTGVLALYRSPHLTATSVLVCLFGSSAQRVVDLAPFAGIATYVAVVITSYIAYALTKWTNAPEPNKFREGARTMNTLDLQNKLIDAILGSINQNQGRLAAKIGWVRAASILLLVEVAVVAILLLISNL